MLKKQIYTLIGIALATILIVVGAWAIKSGKFAGLADTGPAEIDVFTHDASNPAQPVGFVDILVSSDGQNYFPASPPLQTQSNGHVIYSDPVFQNHTLYLKASKPYHSVSPEYRQLSVSSGNKYNTDFTVTPITQDSTKGKLKGKVTESGTNNPLNGAFIAVAKGTQVSNTGYSNAQGDYGIANIVPDTYTIISYRNGYQRKETPNITITANQETTLNISLSKESSPTPAPSKSSSPSPSAELDRDHFLFTAEVVDTDTQELIKDVKVSIKINPAINGAVGATSTTKDSPIDESKYQNNNLLIKVPYPYDCYSMRTKYTVELFHPAYETQTLPDIYCYDISFSDRLQTYLYNAGRVALTKTTPSQDETSLCGVVSDLDTKKPIRDVVVSLIQDNNITTIFAKTNKDGKYCLESDPGKFTVFAYHPAYYDNKRAVKKIILKKGKNELNFELKFIVQDFYDLKIKIVDENNNSFSLEELYKLRIYMDESGIREDLLGSRSDIFGSRIYPRDYKTEEGIFIFDNLVCRHPFALKIDPFEPIIRNDRYIFYQDKIEGIFFNCEGKGNSFEKIIQLDTDSFIDDPSKFDLSGSVSMKSSLRCGRDKILYPLAKYNLYKIIIELVSSDGHPERDRITEPDMNGVFNFVDLESGEYELKATSNQDFFGNKNMPIYSKKINLTNGTKDLECLEDDCYTFIQLVIDEKSEFIHNENFFGIKFYYIGPLSEELSEIINFSDIAKKLADINSELKDNIRPEPAFPEVTIVDSSWHDAGYAEKDPSLGPCANSAKISFSVSSYPYLDPYQVFVHEYGHHIFKEGLSRDNSDYQNWRNMFESAENSINSNCVFGVINDSNIDRSFSISGHPQHGANEFFASFVNAYFNHHERLLTLIRSLPEGSECRNILEFAWQFFSEKVAKTPGESIDTASAANSIHLYSNDDEIFGPIVGGKIGNNIYTPDQIAKGLWKQSVYDQLKPTQKAQLRASLAYRRALNYLKIDPEKYRNQIDINVVKFNSFIDKMLGTRGDRGSIEGVVKEQNGGPKIPKENAIVIIGKKMAVTDKGGKFKIENIKTGEQKVRIIDGTTSKNLNVDLETVNIQKDKTIKRYFNVN